MDDLDELFGLGNSMTLGPGSTDGGTRGTTIEGYLQQMLNVCIPEAGSYVVIAFPQQITGMRVMCARGGCATPAVVEFARFAIRLAEFIESPALIPEALYKCCLILQHPGAHKRVTPAPLGVDLAGVHKRVSDMSRGILLRGIASRSGCEQLMVAVFFDGGVVIAECVGEGCLQLDLIYALAKTFQTNAPGRLADLSALAGPGCSAWIAQAQRMLDDVAPK